ncbi:MAG TPA: UDP-glucose 4-epimerase GalE [Burkholderiales bacterium]|nr:UDP-glucose 4-epimerase GalE [Burkholderiales bacterium]
MKVLVVGGAGYIGSQMVLMLHEQGHQVVVLDDLSAGHREAVLGGEFVEGSIADTALLDRLFVAHRFDGVMHFASFIQVGESVIEPSKYYRNNLSHTLNLLDAMVRHGVKRFIFSSTAAIFGEPRQIPIDEVHPADPINPYGRTKWMVEQALRDYDLAYGLKSVCLRYFNAAGADPKGRIGELHQPETHLIPLVLQAAAGKRPHISVFGTDYDTPDGTCIRDYIHVVDLCTAHLLALDALMQGAQSDAFNLGNGAGFSIRQVIDAARRVTDKSIAVVEGPRRAGDPARLIADPKKIIAALGWKPKHAELESIIRDAWNFHQKKGDAS